MVKHHLWVYFRYVSIEGKIMSKVCCELDGKRVWLFSAGLTEARSDLKVQQWRNTHTKKKAPIKWKGLRVVFWTVRTISRGVPADLSVARSVEVRLDWSSQLQGSLKRQEGLCCSRCLVFVNTCDRLLRAPFQDQLQFVSNKGEDQNCGCGCYGHL